MLEVGGEAPSPMNREPPKHLLAAADKEEFVGGCDSVEGGQAMLGRPLWEAVRSGAGFGPAFSTWLAIRSGGSWFVEVGLTLGSYVLFAVLGFPLSLYVRWQMAGGHDANSVASRAEQWDLFLVDHMVLYGVIVLMIGLSSIYPAIAWGVVRAGRYARPLIRDLTEAQRRMRQDFAERERAFADSEEHARRARRVQTLFTTTG
jgi:hypothetical protein